MLMNQKFWITTAGVLGFLAVATGAFGAHTFSSILDDKMIEVYKTGVLYHLIHSVVILVIALAGIRIYFTAAIFFLVGVILFSFSLYEYALTGISVFAYITPVGGVSFLVGWGLIVYYGWKMHNRV